MQDNETHYKANFGNQLVALVEFHDLFLKLFGLVGCKAQLAEVVAAQLLMVIVSQFRLYRVRA